MSRYIIAVLMSLEGLYYLRLAFEFAAAMNTGAASLWSGLGSGQAAFGFLLIAFAAILVTRPSWTKRGLVPLSLAAILFGGWTVVGVDKIVTSIGMALEGEFFALEEVSGIGFIIAGLVGLSAPLLDAISARREILR